MVIFTTNHPEKIPEEMKRAGRIQHHFELKNCCQSQFEEIFKRYAGQKTYKKIENEKYSVAHVIDVVIPHRKSPEKIFKLLELTD